MKKKQKIRKGRLAVLAGGGLLLLVLIGLAVMKIAPSVMPVIQQIAHNEKTAPLTVISHDQDVAQIQKKNALDTVDVSGFSDEELRACFFSQDLNEELIERLKKMGYTDQVPTGSLKYVRVLYQDFEGKPTVGELVVNAEIAQAVENVFFDLFLHKYEIGKMILPDAYGTRISESFADNNTTALAFGLSEDNRGSLHERGYAIDLNPLYNPLIKDNGTSLSVFPMEGQLYLDRTVNAPHYIYANDYAVQAFEKEGFVWKGNVRGLNDYKHFEYKNAASQTSQDSSQSHDSQSTQNPQQSAPESTPAEERPAEITDPFQAGAAGSAGAAMGPGEQNPEGTGEGELPSDYQGAGAGAELPPETAEPVPDESLPADPGVIPGEEYTDPTEGYADPAEEPYDPNAEIYE